MSKQYLLICNESAMNNLSKVFVGIDFLEVIGSPMNMTEGTVTFQAILTPIYAEKTSDENTEDGGDV